MGIWNANAAGTATPQLCSQFDFAVQPNEPESDQTVAKFETCTFV